MNLPKEGKISGGGGGKEIDSNEEEGNLNGTNKQQTKNGGESLKSNEPSKMSESDSSKKDSEDSRNPTFVVIEKTKTIKKVLKCIPYLL